MRAFTRLNAREMIQNGQMTTSSNTLSTSFQTLKTGRSAKVDAINVVVDVEAFSNISSVGFNIYLVNTGTDESIAARPARKCRDDEAERREAGQKLKVFEDSVAEVSLPRIHLVVLLQRKRSLWSRACFRAYILAGPPCSILPSGSSFLTPVCPSLNCPFQEVSAPRATRPFPFPPSSKGGRQWYTTIPPIKTM